jgi:hypothetical protein
MVQVIVSTMTQPVNSFWLKETELSSIFDTRSGTIARDWVTARDQRERSQRLQWWRPLGRLGTQ